MNNFFLQIYTEYSCKYINSLLDGIEEQGIRYSICNLTEYKELDNYTRPFNCAVIINNNKAQLISPEITKKISFEIELKSIEKLKDFGCDIGRYIKKSPLKGGWNE